MNWELIPAIRFAEFEESWEKFNVQTLASPLLAFDWVRPLLKEFGTGRELLAICKVDGLTCAMAILTHRRRGAWQTFQPSQAPIGMWMHRSEVPLHPMVSSLVRSLPGFPLVLGLTQLDPELTPRPTNIGVVQTLDYVDTGRVRLVGAFDDYWNARGRNLKQNLKKQRNRLEKQGVRIRLECCREAEDVTGVLEDYGRLESAGWKAELGTAIHLDNAQGRFYKSVLESFSKRGLARMYRYWFDDKVVAMDLCIESKDYIVMLKTTYDETLKNGSSPGLLFRQEECAHVFSESRFKTIEFYGKVMDWHLKWTTEVRMLFHLNAYRFNALAYLHSRRKAKINKLPK